MNEKFLILERSVRADLEVVDRLSLALRQTLELRPLYRDQIERFLQFVQSLE